MGVIAGRLLVPQEELIQLHFCLSPFGITPGQLHIQIMATANWQSENQETSETDYLNLAIGEGESLGLT